MDTNDIITEEASKAIQEIKDDLFGDLTDSVDKLDDFFKKHVIQGRIESGYESQYEQLQENFRKKITDFYNKCNKILKNLTI